MTYYATHIEGLRRLHDDLTSLYPQHQAHLTAAIELMRAAQPKDAEAEREYCASVARTIDGTNDTRRVIWAARAVARAEGYEAGKHAADEGLQADTNTVLELAAARAEIERLKTESAETEFLAREIERLRTERDGYRIALAVDTAEIERLRAAYDTQLRRPYTSENELQKRHLNGYTTAEMNARGEEADRAYARDGGPDLPSAREFAPTKLKERDAEIERLREYLDHKEHECAAFVVLHSQCVDARDAALIKLTNLRTAAEIGTRTLIGDTQALRAAIEASK